jgi:pimeloyl-ACP methyl ester carboxylesterase/AraC-like DNA-binding protein
MDVLTDILASLRLTGGVVVDARADGDWCLASQFTADHCAAYFSVPGTLIAYHYVRRGELWASVENQPPVHLNEGSVIILPRNDPHLLFSRAGVPPVSADSLLNPGHDGGPATIRIEGQGAPVEIFCGFLGVSSLKHPLIESLPPILVVEHDDDAGSEWVESSMRFLSEEGRSPEVVARQAELFVGEAIRHYLETARDGVSGWLAGLKDPAVARALAVIHNRYAEDLDIETLAREAGVSRTVLGERFGEMLGEPPMRYCAHWRMRMAANMLRDGRDNTANIAFAVGFNSEAAFSRAFKREYGVPPATWRRQIEAEANELRLAAARTLPEQVVRYCTAKDGTRLAFSAVGDGQPLVKAANWMNHIEHDWKSPLWRHWIRELTQHHCLVRYDERANGLSDWDTPEISFEAFVDDLECVVDCAGLDRFDLLGISQGAAVAIAYAVRHPKRVRKLVLCGGYATGWAVRADADEMARREAMITLTEMGWGSDNPAYRQLFTNLYIPGGSATQAEWFNEAQRLSASPDNAVKLQRALSLIDVRELLSQLNVPTLIFHARGDQVVPFPAGEYLAEHIAGSAFVPLDSENHILLESEPAWRAFAKVTHQFLDADPMVRFVAPMAARGARDTDEIAFCAAPDGAKIAYAVAGEGFPFAKTPNWMTHLEHDWSSPVYGHWLAEGSRTHRLIRADMRGFGMSDWDPPEFKFESLVGDFEAVMDAAGVERCDLLGVSHGGAIAIAYAARHPERVRKLVLVNSFAAGWRVRADPEEIAWRESLLEMNRRQPSFRRSLLGEMFITLYFPSASPELIAWHNELFETLGPVRNMEPMIELASKIDVRDDLEQIRAPTLVCHAKQDGNAMLHVGRQVAEGIADSRFVELDSANHILLGDEPAWPVFTRELRAFLAA